MLRDERYEQRVSSELLPDLDLVQPRQLPDATAWLLWFVACLERSVASSEARLESVLAKGRFWQQHARTGLNERQRKVVNRLLDSEPGGFEGGLTTRKYVAMTGASRATAQREISDLVEQGVLRKRSAGGRSTSYEIVLRDRLEAGKDTPASSSGLRPRIHRTDCRAPNT